MTLADLALLVAAVRRRRRRLRHRSRIDPELSGVARRRSAACDGQRDQHGGARRGGVGSFAKSGRELLDGDGGKLLARSGAVALVGGAVGAGILLVAPDKVFVFVVPYLVALASIALLLQPRLRERMASNDAHPAWWMLGVFVVSVYGGYFGAGAGVMFVAMAMVLSNLPLWRATLLKSQRSWESRTPSQPWHSSSSRTSTGPRRW